PGTGPVRPPVVRRDPQGRRVPRGDRPPGPGLLRQRRRQPRRVEAVIFPAAGAPAPGRRRPLTRSGFPKEKTTMAGYSGTPLVQKLGIKPGHHLVLLQAPDGFDRTLGPLPLGVTVVYTLRGS